MTSKEDFYWTAEAKALKGVSPAPKASKPKPDSVVHIQLDKSTLPDDGKRVSFQTQKEEWHEGYFIEEDKLFWINDNRWFSAFDIVSWKYI